jgi:prepilin-type N-terminal cleavage/methylation domain-containing protein/prepilin-type processing-associated H-X9-DG protein
MSVVTHANSALRAPGQKNLRNGLRARFDYRGGFTLIELLVVAAILAVLAAILFPVLATAKESGRRIRCESQLKQLLASAIAYADDYDSRYVPAARDIYSMQPTGGRWRWHGYRAQGGQDFDPRKGPLWIYMARSGGLKVCPSAKGLMTASSFGNPAMNAAYESGSGGYGYNIYYVGGTYYKNTLPTAAEVASTTSDIARPSRTIMFADAAMARSTPPSVSMVEESFVYPPLIFSNGTPTQLTPTNSPSIHFRHGGYASVGWCDGHVSAERMSFTRDTNVYGAKNRPANLGWFGTDDNTLFDNK